MLGGMARNRIIGAASMREERAPRRVADAAAHAEYREMIVAELGVPDYQAKRPVDDVGMPGPITLLMRPLGLFLLSIVALASVFTVKLWREGWFEQFRRPETPTVAVPTTRWIAGHGEAPPTDLHLPPPELPKTLKPPATQAEPAEDADPQSEATDNTE